MNAKMKKSSLLLAGLLAISACGTQGADEAHVNVENAKSDDGSSSPDDAGTGSDPAEAPDADAPGADSSAAPADSGAVTLEPVGSDAQGEAAAASNDALAQTAPAAMEERNEGNIEQLFASDRWTFDATAGQLLTIDVESVEGEDDGCWQDLTLFLIAPSGDRFDLGWVGNNGCHGHGPYELEEAGEYVIEFAGGEGSSYESTGSYQFTPSILTERDSYPLAFGTRSDGEITQLFGTDRWTFDATAGQLLTIDVESVEGEDDGCWQDLDLFLILPSGDRLEVGWIGNNGCQGHGPFEIDEDGEYALEFAGRSGAAYASTVAYRFTSALSG